MLAMNVPSWDEYFLAIAKQVSTRSKDSQTKHGCVLVDYQNHIVGTGYNSFPAYLPDHELPNTRPAKYPWMIHSEKNAIYNKVGKAATAYCTGPPCFDCLIALYQVGVRRIVVGGEYCWNGRDKEEEENFNRLIEMGDIQYCVHLKVDEGAPTLDEFLRLTDTPNEYFDGAVRE